MSREKIQFCTASDGVRIAYAVTGKGPPLVKVANWLAHLEFDQHSPIWRHWAQELSRDYTYVHYDCRGRGLCGAPPRTRDAPDCLRGVRERGVVPRSRG